MYFKKMDGPRIRAKKVSNTGALYYHLWTNELGERFVQIDDNYGGSGIGRGTFSSKLYRLDNIGAGKFFKGYDSATGATETTHDNNMGAFLRAIKEDVIKRENEMKSHTSNDGL